MSRISRLLGLWLCAGCLTWAPLALAEVPAKPQAAAKDQVPPKFLRALKDKNGDVVALQTATVRYQSAADGQEVVVDLIGVVHIGEKAYYEKLNRQFEQYDALLYELVAPEGTRIPKGGRDRADNPVGMIQGLMKNVLELESQLEHIDYTKKNFVHADLSPDQMAAAMRKRGDDGFTIFLRVLTELMQQAERQEQKRAQGLMKEQDIDILSLFFDPGRGLKLKRILAQQFDDAEAAAGGLGATLATLLITDRNEAAMKVLHKELAKGKKKIGIFYGAAHLPDFDKRLRAELGLKPVSEEWLTAWDLKPKKKGPSSLLERLGK